MRKQFLSFLFILLTLPAVAQQFQKATGIMYYDAPPNFIPSDQYGTEIVKVTGTNDIYVWNSVDGAWSLLPSVASAVDSTRLVQDSILVYWRDASEIRRDTLAVGAGGGGAVSTVNGQSGSVNLTAADVGAVDLAELNDSLAAKPDEVGRVEAERFPGATISERLINAAIEAESGEGEVFLQGQPSDISTFPYQTYENTVITSENPDVIKTGTIHPDVYRVHNTRSAKATGLPVFHIKPDKLSTFLSSPTKKVVVMSTSLGTQAVGTSPLDSYTSKLAMSLSSVYGDIEFERRAIGASNASMFNSVVGPSGGVGSFDPNDDQYAWAETDKTWIEHVEDEAADLLILGWTMNDAGTFSTHDAYRRMLDTIATWEKVPSVLFVTAPPPTLADDFAGSPSQISVNESSAYLRAYAQVHPMVAGCLDANRIGMMKLMGVDPASPVYADTVISLPDTTGIVMPSPAKEWEIAFDADWSATGAVNRYIRIRTGGQNADEIQIFPNRGTNTRNIVLQTQTQSYTVNFRSDAKDTRAPGRWKIQVNFPYIFVEFDGDIMYEGLIGVPGEHGWHTPTLLSNHVGGYTFQNITYRPAKGADYLPSISYTQAVGAANGNAQQPKPPFGGNGVNHFSSLAYSEIYQVAFDRTIWPVSSSTGGVPSPNDQSFTGRTVPANTTTNFPGDNEETYLSANTGGGDVIVNMTDPNLIPPERSGVSRIIQAINGGITTVNANGNVLFVDATSVSSVDIFNGELLICHAIGGVWRCNRQAARPKQSRNVSTNTTFPDLTSPAGKNILALHFVNPGSNDTITLPPANQLAGDERGQVYEIHLINGSSVVLRSQSNTLYMPDGVGNISSGGSRLISVSGRTIRLHSRGDLWVVDYDPRVGTQSAVSDLNMSGNEVTNAAPATAPNSLTTLSQAQNLIRSGTVTTTTDTDGIVSLTLPTTPAGPVIVTLSNSPEIRSIERESISGTTLTAKVQSFAGVVGNQLVTVNYMYKSQ